MKEGGQGNEKEELTVVLVANLLGLKAFSNGLGFCGCAVLVRATNEERVAPTQAGEPEQGAQVQQRVMHKGVREFLLYCFDAGDWVRLLVMYLAKTSAESTQPMMLPRCGTLLTYGSADCNGNPTKRTRTRA